MEKEVFLDKLKKLVALGKSKQNALDATEINDFFAGDNLGPEQIKIGTLISNMIPMSIVLQIAWIIVVVIWMSIGFPFGPGVGVALPAGIL